MKKRGENENSCLVYVLSGRSFILRLCGLCCVAVVAGLLGSGIGLLFAGRLAVGVRHVGLAISLCCVGFVGRCLRTDNLCVGGILFFSRLLRGLLAGWLLRCRAALGCALRRGRGLAGRSGLLLLSSAAHQGGDGEDQYQGQSGHTSQTFVFHGVTVPF